MENHPLSVECQIFCQYLIQQKPDSYITQKYQQAHQFGDISLLQMDSPFERCLLRLAGIHPFMTRLADAYSSVLFSSSILRKKLVLLVAILESSQYSQGLADMPEPSTRMTFLARCVVEGTTFVCMASLAFIFLLPLHLCCVLYSWMSLEKKPE